MFHKYIYVYILTNIKGYMCVIYHTLIKAWKLNPHVNLVLWDSFLLVCDVGHYMCFKIFHILYINLPEMLLMVYGQDWHQAVVETLLVSNQSGLGLVQKVVGTSWKVSNIDKIYYVQGTLVLRRKIPSYSIHIGWVFNKCFCFLFH